MIRLVPEWAIHYEEFWESIRRRNLWFIKLRFLFIILLLLFYIGGEFVFKFQLSLIQQYIIIIIAISLLVYNVIIQDLKNHISSSVGKFNHMHLSLVQMILDLSALMILVIFTGNNESPLKMFFIFQMVVGSLILPGYIVYMIGIGVVAVFSALIFLQHYGFVQNHYILGLYNSPPSSTFEHNVIFIIMFTGMMMISVLLANTIAIRLYQREKQLWETLGKLNEVEAAKQKYIIGVVHEIKTPIAAVQSLLDIVLNGFMGPVSEAIQEKLTRAKIRTVESINLINNILHLSKIKLLNITNQEEIYLSEILESIYDKQRDTAIAKNIELLLEDKRETRRAIKGDHVLFQLAFSNLISNAIKYNFTNGKVLIEITENSENIIVSIVDDGIGIPQKDIDRIFDQFFRASNIKGQSIDGSGMGLSVVNEVIVRYLGKIEVKSPSKIGTSERPGTCFKITLPYDKNSVKKPNKRKKKALRIHDGI